MNTYVSSVVAAERHQSYIAQAAAHRRSRGYRPARSNGEPRRHRVGAFLKDLAAAAL
jgi:hypothetical protein